MRELLVCVNRRLSPQQASCGGRGGEAIAAALEACVRRRQVDLAVVRIHCLGHCEHGPNVRLAPGGRFWRGVSESDAESIVDEVERSP